MGLPNGGVGQVVEKCEPSSSVVLRSGGLALKLRFGVRLEFRGRGQVAPALERVRCPKRLPLRRGEAEEREQVVARFVPGLS